MDPARQVINRNLSSIRGDLTDSTNGGFIPDGPYQAEWDTYRQILESAGMTADFYYDMPGNHDQYNDGTFAYYRANSIQGVATGKPNPPGRGNSLTGAIISWGPAPRETMGRLEPLAEDNFGDHAGLDVIELADIDADLASHTDAQLTLIFGHHPFEPYYRDGSTRA